MKQERHSTVWVSGLTVVIILLVGVLIGKGWDRTGYASENYEELQIFAEVLSQVKKHYVEETKMEDLVHGAVRGMLAGLDPHSSYMTLDMYKEMQVETKGEFGGLGIQIGIKDNRLTVIAPIEDTPAFAAGIKAGDIIVKVGDTPTKDLTLMEAVQKMRGPKGTSVNLTVFREGEKQPLVFDITRDTIKIQSVRSKVIGGNTGYIRITQFQEQTPEDLANELEKLKEQNIQGLILDLRNNPGGLLTAAVGVAEQFLKSGKLIVSIKGRNGREDEYRARDNGEKYQYPMIVLINQGSASASEIVAAAMQDWGKAVILGMTSFGKGSVQTILPLSDGSGLRLTTAKYYTPKGESIHKIGVKPDIVVDPKTTAHAKTKKETDEEAVSLPQLSELENTQASEGGDDKKKDEDTGVPPDDVQLQKALELLKTWKVFKQLRPAA
ncbi:MAG: S41 family peptidase [Nitrospirales bacterium]|nr:S41 family peptidase [Nitrospira sp.]MDR4501670.1 S41 family peptidase [Nitrospirales bacterium]